MGPWTTLPVTVRFDFAFTIRGIEAAGVGAFLPFLRLTCFDDFTEILFNFVISDSSDRVSSFRFAHFSQYFCVLRFSQHFRISLL